MAKANSIPVLDNTNRVISKTTSAKARILVKNNKASIFSTDPFMIKLMDQSKEIVMSRGFFDFSEFFKEEHPVFVQNISNTVLSFGFKTSSGQEFPIPIPNTPKPVCLTDYVSFDMLKDSIDFRKMVNRIPKVLKILSKEEFLKYYQNMADMNGTSLEEELDKGHLAHAGITNRDKLYNTTTESAKTTSQVAAMMMQTEKVVVEEQPSPRVVGMCSKVSADLEDKDCMPESDFVERLVSLADLTEADLDYLQSHGRYKKVKTWAAKQLEALVLTKKSSK